MGKIKIITDSTSYISKEFKEKVGLEVVSLNYIFDDETFKEGFRGEYDDFFKKLESTKLFPTTSQPSAGEFYDAFVDSLKDHDEIIAIVLSSKLSGTYNSAVLAKNMLEDKKVTIIDSETSASNLRFLVEDALDMVNLGKSSEEIVNFINDKKKNMHILLTTGTLEYLSRGGRLSSVQSTIGNFLSIKPIIELQDGELKLIEKVRGSNKAISFLIDKIPSDVQKISICQILNIDEAKKVKILLEAKYPNAEISIDELGPVIGAHLGPKTLGICYY
ncbi:DegV family protein [Tissierella sp. Yu-01]|uniref:DegV family protein n=1 Tax=Tissierella sp. Yu-01 TaxID=3035694 RepID=UPI00240E8186|nr:DegV family protein [Tissierella sp. Yu-01]WFA09650.1 DegV family protein [Tissierella sp. Yu-01]